MGRRGASLSAEHKASIGASMKRSHARRKGQTPDAPPVEVAGNERPKWAPPLECADLYRDLLAKLAPHEAKKLVIDHMRIKRIGPFAVGANP